MPGFLGMSSDQWGMAGQGFGGLMSGFGNYQSYRAQAKWQSASAEVNEMLAGEAKKKAAWQASRLRLEKRKWIGEQRAMFGWAGVELEGSPMDVLAEADREMELDAQMTTREGYIEQQMYLSEAKWARQQAAAMRKAGKSSMLGGLVQGGLSVAGMFAF